MIALTHFVADGAPDGEFATRARRALDALSECKGYLRGSLGRSTDDDTHWVLVTEWENVGSYRRALGAWDVKLHANPLLAEAIDLPSSYEPLVTVVRGEPAVVRRSDRGPAG